MLIKFDIQWNVLQDIKKQDSHEVPNLTKNNSRIKWLDSFKSHLNAIVGIINCPMVYVMIEQHYLLGVTCFTLLSDQPHSEEYGSVEVEKISLTSHDHQFFRNDNLNVYDRV